MTAEAATNEGADTAPNDETGSTVRLHTTVASVFFVIGLALWALTAFQLVVPDLLGGVAVASYGRVAPAARTLIFEGWLIIGLLGLSYPSLVRVTSGSIRRSVLIPIALGLLTLGSAGGAVAILLGLGTGVPSQPSPWWARAIVALGTVFAAWVTTSTARQGGDRLGAAGWYLTGGPLILAVSAIVGLVPTPDGFAGPIVTAFAQTGVVAFVVTSSVGLLYGVFSRVSGADPTEPRPLAALGFWSTVLVWVGMAGSTLIYSPAPNWLESIAVAMAIAAFVPVLTVATDIGLVLRGTVEGIADRRSLWYATLGGAALAAAVVVNFLVTWPASSGIVQYSPWVQALWALIVGGASFAIFAAFSVHRGGARRSWSIHGALALIGFAGVVVSLTIAGIATGFSWAAGPTSQKFPNWGQGWEVTVNTQLPLLWSAAISVAVLAVSQVVYLARLGTTADDDLYPDVRSPDVDLGFLGRPRYATWGRLMGGLAAMWIVTALVTMVLPALDGTEREATLLSDTARTYESGSPEADGRAVFQREGCTECHTQEVRPIATDVGLGAVSIAGDFANERPILRGALRYGPDLMHLASRDGFDAAALVQRLDDPRTAVPWSNMPSYAHLSDDDVQALVRYLETLE